MRDMTRIVRLGPGDVQDARRLVHAFLGEPARPVDLRGWLWDRRNVMVGAFEEGEPAGLVYGHHLPRPDATGDMLLLYSIDVAEPHRRRGLGRRLVDAFREHAGPGGTWLVTNESSEAAMELYRSCGAVRPHRDDVMLRL